MEKLQDKLLKENYDAKSEKLIIFLTSGYDEVNGGILSISSIYEESIKLKQIHESEVIMCTIPGDPPLLRYTKFNNQNYIYRFSQALNYFQNLESLMIHIPEYVFRHFLENLSSKDCSSLARIKNKHFNIMIQNIKLLSSIDIELIKKLKYLVKVTATTAHEQYSNSEVKQKIGVPLHKLSVYVSPEQYERKSYNEKEELMIVSPDSHPQKMKILALLDKQLPYLKIRIIEDLSYQEYKKLISRAKWALTFGEGLDGYFVETVFSGGVSFAVYNSDFFTPEFKSLRTVYGSYEALAKSICSDIIILDDEVTFTEYQDAQYRLCSKYYSYKQYIKNLELFYRGDYTYE